MQLLNSTTWETPNAFKLALNWKPEVQLNLLAISRIKPLPKFQFYDGTVRECNYTFNYDYSFNFIIKSINLIWYKSRTAQVGAPLKVQRSKASFLKYARDTFVKSCFSSGKNLTVARKQLYAHQTSSRPKVFIKMKGGYPLTKWKFW